MGKHNGTKSAFRPLFQRVFLNVYVCVFCWKITGRRNDRTYRQKRRVKRENAMKMHCKQYGEKQVLCTHTYTHMKKERKGQIFSLYQLIWQRSMHFKWPFWLYMYNLWKNQNELRNVIIWKGHFWMDLVACEPTSTWQCNMHLHTSPISSPGGRRRQESGLLKGTWQDKLRGQGNIVRGW